MTWSIEGRRNCLHLRSILCDHTDESSSTPGHCWRAGLGSRDALQPTIRFIGPLKPRALTVDNSRAWEQQPESASAVGLATWFACSGTSSASQRDDERALVSRRRDADTGCQWQPGLDETGLAFRVFPAWGFLQ